MESDSWARRARRERTGTADPTRSGRATDRRSGSDPRRRARVEGDRRAEGAGDRVGEARTVGGRWDRVGRPTRLGRRGPGSAHVAGRAVLGTVCLDALELGGLVGPVVRRPGDVPMPAAGLALQVVRALVGAHDRQERGGYQQRRLQQGKRASQGRLGSSRDPHRRRILRERCRGGWRGGRPPRSARHPAPDLRRGGRWAAGPRFVRDETGEAGISRRSSSRDRRRRS